MVIVCTACQTFCNAKMPDLGWGVPPKDGLCNKFKYDHEGVQ
jgi:hypothetical protein